MHREVKRVPMDFDAPLDKVWRGYLLPDELAPLACPVCGPEVHGSYGQTPDGQAYGDGMTREARAIDQTFYPTQISMTWNENDLKYARLLAWGDKLGQAEVDNLVAEGRLQELRRVPEDQWCGEPCNDAPDGATWLGESCKRFRDHDGSHHPRASEWVTVPRKAAEVNAANRTPGIDSHDGINRGILVEFRCKVLGIAMTCPRCEGHGYVFRDEDHRQAHDAWEPTDPPKGDGWQLWTTTTEGSPISPVFATPEELAEYAADNCTVFGHTRQTRAQWLASFVEDTLWEDSALIDRGDGRGPVVGRGVA